MKTLTREHNYRLSLDILRKRGLISEEDYIREADKGEALISYLGIGNLTLIDGNREPFYMERGDMVLLCSDGLYKSVEEDAVLNILLKYRNVQNAAVALTDYAISLGRTSQDNTSVILLRYS